MTVTQDQSQRANSDSSPPHGSPTPRRVEGRLASRRQWIADRFHEPEPVIHRQGVNTFALVVAIVLFGLVLQSSVFISGHLPTDFALTLFFVGLLLTFIPCAARLLGKSATKQERLAVVVVMTVALYASSILGNPLMPTGFDDLLHQTTLWQIAYYHKLFTNNAVLTVSPYYPGLELTTLGVKAITGLPSTASEFLVIALARLVLSLSIYNVANRLVRDERAGGVALVIYALSPQFYSFNSAYSYQSLAIAFAAGATYLLLKVLSKDEPRAEWRYWFAIVLLSFLTITHHLVSWLNAAFLIGWVIVLARSQHTKRQVRLLGFVAAWAAVSCALWGYMAGAKLVAYISPILSLGFSGMLVLFTGGKKRALFESATGWKTPLWEEFVILFSVLLTIFVIYKSIRAVRRGTLSLRSALIPILGALAYPAIPISSLSSNASQVGQRASTFIYFGIAILVAAWMCSTRFNFRRSIITTAVSVAFLGSMIFGTGPSWTYVPGPYMPVADSHSIDAYSIAAANWAAAHLPVGSHIAADRDDAVLMSSIGHLEPVMASDGLVNVGPIYLDPSFGRYQMSLIKQGRIQYLLVDDRLADGPPTYGYYFEPGETQGQELLTHQDLSKFAYIPGFRQIYDNGPIQIYDLSSLLAKTTTVASPPLTGIASTKGNLAGFIGFVVLGALLVLAFRWRRGRAEERLLEGLLGLIALALAFGLLVVFAHVPAGIWSPVVLIALLLGARQSSLFRPLFNYHLKETWIHAFRPRSTWIPGAVAVAVLVATATLEVTSARHQWTPPRALSIISVSRSSAIDVDIGPANSSSIELEVLHDGKVVWKTTVSKKQSLVRAPSSVLSNGNTIELMSNGAALLNVTA